MTAASTCSPNRIGILLNFHLPPGITDAKSMLSAKRPFPKLPMDRGMPAVQVLSNSSLTESLRLIRSRIGSDSSYAKRLVDTICIMRSAFYQRIIINA
jgi:hypothetical protein